MQRTTSGPSVLTKRHLVENDDDVRTAYPHPNRQTPHGMTCPICKHHRVLCTRSYRLRTNCLPFSSSPRRVFLTRLHLTVKSVNQVKIAPRLNTGVKFVRADILTNKPLLRLISLNFLFEHLRCGVPSSRTPYIPHDDHYNFLSGRHKALRQAFIFSESVTLAGLFIQIAGSKGSWLGQLNDYFFDLLMPCLSVEQNVGHFKAKAHYLVSRTHAYNKMQPQSCVFDERTCLRLLFAN